jgi:hypothetical protein
MDPAVPLQSVRELAARHRWLGGGPPVPLSVLSLCARHHPPETTEHRLLWYNTYLIHGMQLSLCSPIHIGRLLPAIPPLVVDKLLSKIAPGELVTAFNLTTQQLADAFGITKETLVHTFPNIVDSFVEKVTSWIPFVGWVVETVKKAVSDISRADILGKLSPQELIDKFEFMTPDQIVTKLGLDIGLVAAAFCERFLGALSDVTGLPLDATVDIKGAAPDRPLRARAIGEMLGKEYAIAGLCEVFEPDRQADVIASAAKSGRETAAHRGPGADGELAGSGLLTVTFDGRSKRRSGDALDSLLDLPGVWIFGGDSDQGTTRIFSNQGSRLLDADAWSRKGVLLTVVSLGAGKVDLYTTHLYKGGDIGVFGDPSDEHIWKVKQSQIEEIVDFIRDSHTPGHVAILMGDLNIAATSNRLATLNMVDLWPFWREPTGGAAVIKPHGSTDDPDTVCLDKNKPFCIEPDVPLDSQGKPRGQRIDYVFVERPRAAHGFTLDFTRMRRRAFQFPQTDEGFMSDHVGLDVTLIANGFKA